MGTTCQEQGGGGLKASATCCLDEEEVGGDDNTDEKFMSQRKRGHKKSRAGPWDSVLVLRVAPLEAIDF